MCQRAVSLVLVASAVIACAVVIKDQVNKSDKNRSSTMTIKLRLISDMSFGIPENLDHETPVHITPFVPQPAVPPASEYKLLPSSPSHPGWEFDEAKLNNTIKSAMNSMESVATHLAFFMQLIEK